jgi:hypothetical protein
LGHALAGLAAQIPQADLTRRVALSYLFLGPVAPATAKGKTGLSATPAAEKVCALLTVRDLAEVLKWPVCVGDAQSLVLAQLEKRTQRNFGGEIGKFIGQVDLLGAPGLSRATLDRPAQRPKLEDAVKELEAIGARTPSRADIPKGRSRPRDTAPRLTQAREQARRL